MRQTRKIAAYGRCRDEAGRVLLARASASTEVPGVWQFPGGDLLHGEHPADAVVREFALATGLVVGVVGVRTVVSDLMPLPWQSVLRHTDRVVYDVIARGGGQPSGARAGGGQPGGAPSGGTDQVAWVSGEEAAALPLMPFTAELLGLPAGPVPAAVEPIGPGARREAESVQLLVDPAVLGPAGPLPEAEIAGAPAASPGPSAVPVAVPGNAAAGEGGRPVTGQRFAAYGLVTDPAGRILLTLIADGYPGAGHWHLPGGGTDHGEQPATGFLRELVEEAGQIGRLTGLMDVSHRRSMALGPEGYPLDWHAVRVLYRAVVDTPTPPRVTEAAGGSTARAAWFAPEGAAQVPLTEIALHALGKLATSEAIVVELHS